MKQKSILSKTFSFKVLLIITGTVIGFGGFTNCNAQSIIGKWNQVSTKQYFNPEDAKKLGKSFVETPTGSAGNTAIEFKTDHTYVKTLSGKYQPKPVLLTGSWKVSGNQFEMKIDAKQANPKFIAPKGSDSNSDTASLEDDTLIVTTTVPANNPLGMKIIKIEATYKRI